MSTASGVLRSIATSALAVVAVLSAAVGSSVSAAVVESPQVIRFHGGGDDRAGAIALDGAGNMYLGGAVGTPNTGITFAVVKLNARGELIWRTTYSGARGGTLGAVSALAVDAAGNVFAGGHISDDRNVDSLVLKLGPDGSERWAQRYDGPGGGYDQVIGLAVDQSGAVYATGNSYGTGFDWVTQRFGSDGTLQWTRRHSGPGSADDVVGDMMLGPNGDLVVAGVTRNTPDALTNDIEIVSYRPSGEINWRQQWTDTPISHELVEDMDVDAAGGITVTGSTARNPSPEFGVPLPITLRYNASGSLQQTIRAGGNAVAVDSNGGAAYLVGSFMDKPQLSQTTKYDAAGNLVWVTPLALNTNEFLVVTGIVVDAQGVATVAGTVHNPRMPAVDYLTIRYSSDGRELWRHRFNGLGNGDDRVAGLAVDSANGVLVTGTSWGDYSSSGDTDNDILTLRFPAGVTPSPDLPPVAPSHLVATSASRSQIRLNWHDNSDVETGLRIERCRGSRCTDFAQIAVLGSDVTTFLDSGLARNTSYTYRVQATNTAGSSLFSNPFSAKTRVS
ncbi:hypothetical protein FKR81_12890 [Lentzea tibetensis]|uniref:Fibronectin type-III domain-containing protein n=1 Tax=Lentzea tibetensis TaxID=2591470 RepID=A0A563EVP1_9PSEU|nr:hypothetical protein [Lentzea tibetensis]TWP51756.1 hypothetical protein FKR81_12890 [Lentzea tibetensis]